ncbi:MAG: ABC transporter permease [Pseudomonadota bacterium]
MKTIGTVLKRLLYAFSLVMAVVVLNFLLIRLAPGDPALTIAGEMGGATEEIINDIRREYGLDKSLPEQLLVYMQRMLTGDLGDSLFFNSPVLDLILERLGPTILLVVTALVLSVIIGTILGVLASRNPEGLFSSLVTVFSLVGYSAPVFWTGIMLLIIFSSAMPLFPLSGMIDISQSATGIFRMLDIAHHLVLPAFTLSIIFLAQYSRISRASMLDVMGADYIRTARAKGLSERLVTYKHALRNAVLPVVTLAGLQFGGMLSGAVLVETVFNWPGLGQLAFESILRRDHPTILGILFFASLMVVVANLLTDLTYRIVDPRIGTASGGHR